MTDYRLYQEEIAPSGDYKVTQITDEEMSRAGQRWLYETLTWKAGTVHNQMDGIGDPNWCTGAAWANLIEGVTGQLVSGRKIYEDTRETFASDEDKPGASLHESGHILLRNMHALDGPNETDLVHLRTFRSVMAWLMTRGPVVFGCRWHTGMLYPRSQRCATWMEYAGPAMSPHAACIIGSSHKRRGFLRIENSLGLGWGSKGLSWMPHKHFAKLFGLHRVEAMGLRLPEHKNA